MRGSPRFPMSDLAKLLKALPPSLLPNLLDLSKSTCVTNAVEIANLLNFQASSTLLVTKRTP
jgi:hypothetical protein